MTSASPTGISKSPNLILHTDGSSQVLKDFCHAGQAVGSYLLFVAQGCLPNHMAAQAAQLITLVPAMHLAL